MPELDVGKLLQEHKGHTFQAKPFFSEDGKCWFYYTEDAESYVEWIDHRLTVYRAMDDRRIVGCRLTIG